MELDFDTYKAQQFCDNPDCDAYGKVGENNIRTHSRLQHQVYCNVCNQIWVITKGTFFYNLKAPVSLILEVLKLLSEGMGIRAVSLGCPKKPFLGQTLCPVFGPGILALECPYLLGFGLR